MFSKIKQKKTEQRVITGRGPGTGTGQTLPDDEAIAILDERIEKPEKKNPDLGVVIDSAQSAAPISFAPRLERSLQAAPPMFDPTDYTDFEHFWTRKVQLFKPDVPEFIVIASKLETPVESILSCTYGGKTWRTFTDLWVRLLLEHETIDLDLPKHLPPRSTLLDLVEKTRE